MGPRDGAQVSGLAASAAACEVILLALKRSFLSLPFFPLGILYDENHFNCLLLLLFGFCFALIVCFLEIMVSFY